MLCLSSEYEMQIKLCHWFLLGGGGQIIISVVNVVLTTAFVKYLLC